MHLYDILLLAISAIPALSSPIEGGASPVAYPRSLLSTRQKHDVTEDLKGTGRILVINSTDYSDNNAKAKTIGCLNSVGKVVPTSDSGCAVFDFIDGNVGLRRDPSKIYSPSGNNCTFHNIRQPENTDSYYGKGSYSFYCGKTPVEDTEGAHWLEREGFYTVNGFPQVFLCTDNIVCTYDMLAPPAGWETGSDSLPIWHFRWGGQDYRVVKGHTQVILFWDRTE